MNESLERQKQRERAMYRTRNMALARLRDAHPEEYARYKREAELSMGLVVDETARTHGLLLREKYREGGA